jgi:hypothetical protein
MRKLFTLIVLAVTLLSALPANSQNLIAGWDGNGVTGTLSKPTDVGWVNTITASIPWNTANSTSGCRFRDYNVTGGYTGYTMEATPGSNTAGVTYTNRFLMFRWDNGTYSSSIYAYPVTLEACATYTFTLDYVCGGSATPPQNITVGISTTANSTGRLSSKVLASTTSAVIFRSGTYTFTTGSTGGTYYLTFNGAAAWFGVAKMNLVKSADQSLTASKAYMFFDNSSDNVAKTFFVQGGALTNPITLTAPAGITLNTNSISAADAQCGVNITATFDNSKFINNDTIFVSSGLLTKKIVVDAVKNNLIGSWDGNGDTAKVVEPLSLPTKYGWVCPTVTWAAANLNTVGTCRYFDNPSNYVYNGLSFNGRILYARWDGNNTAGVAGVFALPVTLESCKSYTFKGKFAWNSNGSAPTLTLGVNSSSDNTGTAYGSSTVVTGAALSLINGSNTFVVPTTGTYYITLMANTGSLCGIADLSLVENTAQALNTSATSLFFDDSSSQKTFNVSGIALGADITLTAPSGVTLDKTAITAANAQCGVIITATFDKATTITGGTISITSGSLSKSITVNTSVNSGCFTPSITNYPNMVTTPYMNSLSPFTNSWGSASIVSGSEAYCGNYSGKITGAAVNSGSITTPAYTWIPSHIYKIKAMVNTVDGTFNMGFQNVYAAEAGGATANYLLTVPNTTGAWQEFSATFTAGASATSGYIYFNNSEGASGLTGYIDNWELYDITGIVNAVKNPNASVLNVFLQGKKIVADFNLDQSAEASFVVYNVQGMMISKSSQVYSAGKNRQLINGDLSSGVYFVKMTSNGKSIINKIIK